jgi:hypothetical protein
LLFNKNIINEYFYFNFIEMKNTLIFLINLIIIFKIKCDQVETNDQVTDGDYVPGISHDDSSMIIINFSYYFYFL